MALPALLDLPDTTWIPGDPLYCPPTPLEPTALGAGARLRDGGGRPMQWTAAEAVPAPWGWLSGDAATGVVSR